MIRLFLLLISLFFLNLIPCIGTNKSDKTFKAVQKTDSCKMDSKNTYEVYIPPRVNSTEKFPLLVIIDAHGSGKFALDKFKLAAKQYPTVLIASNLIKNGFEGSQGAIRTLIEDVRQKYPIGETVFMTGFSGGARMALGYGLSFKLNGLILCGALANADQIKQLHCPVISVSGMDDFNFMETAQYLFQEQLTPANLKIELTSANHNWPDSLTLANELGFLSLSCQPLNISSQTQSQLKLYSQKQLIRINSLKQRKDFLRAALLARNMSSTEPFNRDKTFALEYNTLKVNTQYINQLKRLEKCLQFEISMRQSYVDDFRTKDSIWWKNQIIETEEKIKTQQDSYNRDMYRRIKGFWGIVCYSLCNQAVKEQDAQALVKILSVYRMLEPENPDMFYFCAFPYFWKGNNVATLKMVEKALKAGFSDKSQLKKDFPSFITSKLD
jgi:hypothetical protein